MTNTILTTLVASGVALQVGKWTLRKIRNMQSSPRRRIPARTKTRLYKDQGGFCGGCAEPFAKRNLEVDHIWPVSRGGTDEYENLQLLCGHCNRVKGDRTQKYLEDKFNEIQDS